MRTARLLTVSRSIPCVWEGNCPNPLYTDALLDAVLFAHLACRLQVFVNWNRTFSHLVMKWMLWEWLFMFPDLAHLTDKGTNDYQIPLQKYCMFLLDHTKSSFSLRLWLASWYSLHYYFLVSNVSFVVSFKWKWRVHAEYVLGRCRWWHLFNKILGRTCCKRLYFLSFLH